jgi:hypothetical protein
MFGAYADIGTLDLGPKRPNRVNNLGFKEHWRIYSARYLKKRQLLKKARKVTECTASGLKSSLKFGGPTAGSLPHN